LELDYKVVEKSLWQSDTWLRGALTVLAFLFPIVVLTVNRADSYTLAAVSLAGIYLACRRRRYALAPLNGSERALLAVFVLYFLIAGVSYYAGLRSETGFHILGRQLRFIFVIPAYLAFRWARPSTKAVVAGLILGTLTTGAAALFESIAPPGAILLRATGDTMAIVFGDLALLGGFMGIASCAYFHHRHPRLAAFLALVAFAFGVLASVLSGTRGSWISLPVLGAVAVFSFAGEIGRVKLIGIVVLGCAMVAGIYLIPATGVAARIDAGIDNFNTYLNTIRQADRLRSAQAGCVAGKADLDFIARASVSALPSGSRARVVQDKDHLAGAGFARRCAGAHAMEFSDTDPQHHQRFVLARSVTYLAHPSDAELLVRGSGMLAIAGGSLQAYDTATYKKVTLPGGPWREDVLIALKPGEHLWIVPIAHIPGEYRAAFAESSVASRLEMWSAAWRIFLDHPLLGAGTGAYWIKALKQVRRGIAAPVAAQFDHPHNQYLAELANRGIIGLVAFLALLAVPAVIFARALGAASPARRMAGLAGMMVVVGFAVFGLTETIVIHSITITYYTIFIALYAAMASPENAALIDRRR
jgi:O-antigen ligase